MGLKDQVLTILRKNYLMYRRNIKQHAFSLFIGPIINGIDIIFLLNIYERYTNLNHFCDFMTFFSFALIMRRIVGNLTADKSNKYKEVQKVIFLSYLLKIFGLSKSAYIIGLDHNMLNINHYCILF